MAQLREETNKITDYLKKTVRVKVVIKWECEWLSDKREDPRLGQWVSERFPPYQNPFRGLTTIEPTHIVQAVRNGTLFGLVQCDLAVPDHLKSRFSEFPPIFKNSLVSIDDIGEHMSEYARKHDLMKTPRRTLISSFSGQSILLATPLLRWYLDQGLIVSDVQQVVEYVPKTVFKTFQDTVSDARRKGDLNPAQSILADTFKLVGNSGYGKFLTNMEKFTTVRYVSPDKADPLINSARFKKMVTLSDKLLEIELRRSPIKWDLPNAIGYFVYQYAKLRLLQFYYEFLDRFISRADFEMCECDTDSLYFMLSGPSLQAVIKPHLKREFYQEYPNWFPAKTCSQHHPDFVQKGLQGTFWTGTADCCRQRQRLDKRTPGLFKEEYSGDGIVALCSKTYFCFGAKGDKISCKGLQKSINKLTKDRYLTVLTSKQAGGGINKGFLSDGKTVHTYQQHRRSLSYLYVKRKVLGDGIRTKPLDI